MPRPFPFTLFSAAGGGGGCGDLVAESNIMHWWKLNDGAGLGASYYTLDSGNSGIGIIPTPYASTTGLATIANIVGGDKSGTEDTLHFTGGGVYNYTKSRQTTGLGFDTAGDVFSYSFWMKLRTTWAAAVAYPTFWCARPNGGAAIGGLRCYADPDGGTNPALYFNVGDGWSAADRSGIDSTQQPDLVDKVGDWWHVVCVVDRSTSPNLGRIYVNAVAGTDQPGPLIPDPTNAADAPGGNYMFAGSYWFVLGGLAWSTGPSAHASYAPNFEMSDFRIYNIALTEEQVTAIYCDGAGDWPPL